MRTLIGKPAASWQTTPAGRAHPDRASVSRIDALNSIHHFQRMLGNQAVHRLSSATIPVDADPGEASPASREQLKQDLFGPPAVRTIPLPEAEPAGPMTQLIPSSDGGEESVLEPQAAGGGSGSATASGPSESCGTPRSMNKIVSGSFLGGLTMDSYFPDLTGTGSWAHAGTGGTFDTGSRVGGNVQLFGVIPSPCVPTQFHLAQTASITRHRVNGVATSLEGTTVDDVARSGRDFEHAPARQDFLGGGTAPLGYIISMADPPSEAYSATRHDVERDVDFVSSLVGPGGTQSVTWSQSLRVSGGTVTGNTLT